MLHSTVRPRQAGPAVELHLAVERIGEDRVGREAAEVELVPVHHRHIEAATGSGEY